MSDRGALKGGIWVGGWDLHGMNLMITKGKTEKQRNIMFKSKRSERAIEKTANCVFFFHVRFYRVHTIDPPGPVARRVL